LVKFKGDGSLRSIEKWTKEVKPSVDYYGFVENFLILAISFFTPGISRLSKASKLYLHMPQGETGD